MQMPNKEKKQLDVYIVQKFLASLFGGSEYVYEISEAPNTSLSVKYNGDKFEVEIQEFGFSVFLKFDDKFDAMIFRTATVQELKQYMPNAIEIFPNGMVAYPIKKDIIPIISKEVRSLFNDFIEPLKEKILREVTEEFIKNKKLAEKIGRKESKSQ